MLALILAFDLLVFFLACIGMMVVFLGGTGYLPVLLLLLALSLPATLGQAALVLGGLARRHSLVRAFAVAWRNVPQWLAVAFWLGIALVACGELALLVTRHLAERAPAPWQHLPLLAGTSAAVAFLLVFAWRRGR